MKKNKVIYLVILLILVIVALYYAFNMNKKFNAVRQENVANENSHNKIEENKSPEDSISGWKIYEDKTTGIKIGYPNDWFLKERDEDGEGKYIGLIGPDTINKTEGNETPDEDIRINYYASIESASIGKLNNSSAKTVDELIKNDGEMEKIGNIKIGDLYATEVIATGAGKAYILFVEKNGHIYTVTFNYRENRESLTENEEKILSTFSIE